MPILQPLCKFFRVLVIILSYDFRVFWQIYLFFKHTNPAYKRICLKHHRICQWLIDQPASGCLCFSIIFNSMLSYQTGRAYMYILCATSKTANIEIVRFLFCDIWRITQWNVIKCVRSLPDSANSTFLCLFIYYLSLNNLLYIQHH